MFIKLTEIIQVYIASRLWYWWMRINRYLKVALWKLVLIYQKSFCWQTNADRMRKLVLFETALSLLWSQIDKKNSKNYKGEHWQQTTTVNIMIFRE